MKLKDLLRLNNSELLIIIKDSKKVYNGFYERYVYDKDYKDLLDNEIDCFDAYEYDEIRIFLK